MWKKQTVALLLAVASSGTAIPPVVAQGYDRGGYDYGRGNEQYYGPNSVPRDNQYNNYPNGQYDNYPNSENSDRSAERDRYDRERDNYERDRQQYDTQRRATAQWDRDAYYRQCEQQRSGNTAGGAIVGALAGGLLGNSVSRGPQRGAGTAVGAILGGVAGASIGSNLNCEDRSYAIDAQYRGFEAGRPHQRYNWRSPRGGTYGYVEVQDYYRDRGRRCATYTEEIWVRGRPETVQGRACRTPDGNWQMVS